MPEVSVIIPCYNQGPFLDEAVESVLSQTFQDFEIIIVNDGSTEAGTIKLLRAYPKPKTQVIHTSNQGLSAARNNGIKAAQGKYILPLDADDRIESTYLEKAVAILNANNNIGIVYCKAILFGEMSGEWNLKSYNLPDMLLNNLIFCSGFFRRSDWAKTKGYDPKMVYGWEDYDLWLSLIELGREVYCIPEPLFFYRRTSGSMVSVMSREQYIYSHAQIFRNHQQLYGDNIETIYDALFKLDDSYWQQRKLVHLMEKSIFWRVRTQLLRLKRVFMKSPFAAADARPTAGSRDGL